MSMLQRRNASSDCNDVVNVSFDYALMKQNNVLVSLVNSRRFISAFHTTRKSSSQEN
jgi:hypothetical protein